MTISNVTRSEQISEHTKDLIPWLPRETIKAALPQAFKGHFLKHKKPQTWTLEVTVTMSDIMFTSDAFGGKCSDRYITQNSGFLDYLHARDGGDGWGLAGGV